MKVRRPTMKAHSIRAALRGKRQITSKMTYKEFRVACPKLASFDAGVITVGRFAAQSPWERRDRGHAPDGQRLRSRRRGRRVDLHRAPGRVAPADSPTSRHGARRPADGSRAGLVRG
jgi:hypothetical protein